MSNRNLIFLQMMMKWDIPFGVVCVLLVVRASQLSPVLVYSIFDPKTYSDADTQGKCLWGFYYSVLDCIITMNLILKTLTQFLQFLKLVKGWCHRGYIMGDGFNRSEFGIICLWRYAVTEVLMMRMARTITRPIKKFTKEISISWNH